MRRAIMFAILTAITSVSETPTLETVANCSTDSECENGPDETNPFKDE